MKYQGIGNNTTEETNQAKVIIVQVAPELRAQSEGLDHLWIWGKSMPISRSYKVRARKPCVLFEKTHVVSWSEVRNGRRED
jgi:hypothetical protein